jgi:hypothetical protein
MSKSGLAEAIANGTGAMRCRVHLLEAREDDLLSLEFDIPPDAKPITYIP